MNTAVVLRQLRPIKSFPKRIKFWGVITATLTPSDPLLLPPRLSCLATVVTLWGAPRDVFVQNLPNHARLVRVLTRHDGVCDVEVVEGEAQGLPRGWWRGAGSLRRGSGRLGRGGLGGGVPTGLQAVVLCLEKLYLVLEGGAGGTGKTSVIYVSRLNKCKQIKPNQNGTRLL